MESLVDLYSLLMYTDLPLTLITIHKYGMICDVCVWVTDNY